MVGDIRLRQRDLDLDPLILPLSAPNCEVLEQHHDALTKPVFGAQFPARHLPRDRHRELAAERFGDFRIAMIEFPEITGQQFVRLDCRQCRGRVVEVPMGNQSRLTITIAWAVDGNQ